MRYFRSEYDSSRQNSLVQWRNQYDAALTNNFTHTIEEDLVYVWLTKGFYGLVMLIATRLNRNSHLLCSMVILVILVFRFK